MLNDDEIVIYPHQVRMARAVLRMSQHALAAASGVSQRTISSFESANPKKTTRVNRAALRDALEKRGARFTGFGIITEPEAP